MEIQSRYSELSIISQVSAVEGCPLAGFHYTRITILVINLNDYSVTVSNQMPVKYSLIFVSLDPFQI